MRVMFQRITYQVPPLRSYARGIPAADGVQVARLAALRLRHPERRDMDRHRRLRRHPPRLPLLPQCGADRLAPARKPAPREDGLYLSRQ